MFYTLQEFIINHFSTILEVLGFIVAYLSLILPIQKYFQDKSLQERQLQFQNYHKLIGELVGEQGTPKLDRQIAIAYELRNFPGYYDVTLRILKGLHNSWGNSTLEVSRLLKEIDLTIKFIESK
ncbi:MAG: hypothetical protein PHY14_02710 [Candidatus Gracilibacteria bacterium]|nr:hypothetical protein [Candidatus Gracilibacteria bacterium]